MSRPFFTLRQAQDWLFANIDDGVDCPCCGQRAQKYRFAINAAVTIGLIKMYNTGGRDWVHVPSLGLPGGHLLKLRFWDMLEKHPDIERDDGSPRTGWWRITAIGEEWVNGGSTVFSHAIIFNNHCYGLVGKQINVRDALGKEFNYRELMDGVVA